MSSKIGIFAGSFDPVHLGHISFALNAIKQAKLDKVIFLPETKPRGKKPVDIKHRAAMLKLATEKFSKQIEVGEVSHGQFNLSKTLHELSQKYAPTHYLFGSDVFFKMNPNSWPNLNKFLSDHELLIAARNRDTEMAIKNHAKKIEARIMLINSTHPILSSSNIRSKHPTNPSPFEKVIFSYVEKHNLYA